MKKYLTPTNIFMAILVIYSIVMTFIKFTPDASKSDIAVQYLEDKVELLEKVNNLETKIHIYETQLLKIDSSVDQYTYDQLDSAFTALTR